jgi:hypothetical protein
VDSTSRSPNRDSRSRWCWIHKLAGEGRDEVEREGGRGATRALVTTPRHRADVVITEWETAEWWAASTGSWVYGVDGTTLRVPDTAENEAAFGRVPTRWESTGGYPVLRLVALMVLRQHVLTGLALGAYRDSELGLAATLWPQLPDASLVILDREFAAYALFHQLGDATRQRHWLTRARGPSSQPPVVPLSSVVPRRRQLVRTEKGSRKMRAFLIAMVTCLAAACTRPIPLNPVPPVQTAEGRACVQDCQALYNQCMGGAVGGLAVGGPAPGRGKFVNVFCTS